MYPEQKKNNTSPIAPPVDNAVKGGGYNCSICEFVMKKAARNFSISIDGSLFFIVVLMTSIKKMYVLTWTYTCLSKRWSL